MQSEGKSENEMKNLDEPDELTAMNYQNHRLAPAAAMEPTTAKYLLDFLYFTREEEQFRFYKKVSVCRLTGVPAAHSSGSDEGQRSPRTFLRENLSGSDQTGFVGDLA